MKKITATMAVALLALLAVTATATPAEAKDISWRVAKAYDISW